DVLITEEVVDDSIEALARRHHVVYEPELWRDREALLARLADVRGVLVRNMTLVDRAFLEAAPNLEDVGRIGVGMDNLDLRGLTERGVVVCYPPEENAVSVAEHVFALLLALARHVPAADHAVRAGSWDRYSYVGCALAGKT